MTVQGHPRSLRIESIHLPISFQ